MCMNVCVSLPSPPVLKIFFNFWKVMCHMAIFEITQLKINRMQPNGIHLVISMMDCKIIF